MKKLLLLITLFFGVISFAQNMMTDSSAVYTKLPGEYPFVVKWVDAYSCTSSDWYHPDDKSPIYFISKPFECENAGKKTLFLEAFNEGNSVSIKFKMDDLVTVDKTEMTVSEYLTEFKSLSNEGQNLISKRAERYSNRMVDLIKMQESDKKIDKLEKALSYLDSFNKYGIGICEAVPTDDYGMTGAKFRFYNASKKTIKYITFNFYGRNAVKDKVVSYGKSSFSTKGIGPIEPEVMASYNFDSVWLTDIVQTLTLSSVNILYMNGSSKNVVITDAMWIDEDQLEPIYETD